MGKKASTFPDRVNRHRKPETKIRKLGNRYYLYEATGFYDRERKKSGKITGEYLDTINEPEGFVASKTKRVPQSCQRIEIKNITTGEYGPGAFIRTFCSDISRTAESFFSILAEMDTCCITGTSKNPSKLSLRG
jgi:hypothetical protein